MFAILYARTRRTGHAILALSVTSLWAWVWANIMVQLPSLNGNPSALVPLLSFAPLVAACVVGVALHSPMSDLETGGSRRLPFVRWMHAGALVVFAGLVLLAAALRWDYPQAELTVARNLIGFTGLSLLGSVLVGAQRSWILPLGFGLVAYYFAAIGGEIATWAWFLLPSTDPLPLSIGITLFSVGFVAHGLLGVREAKNEVE